MSKLRMTMIALGLGLAVGCGGGGKKAKCEKAWNDAKEMMNAFAKEGEMKKEMEAQMDAMKGLFIDKCTSLPDDVVDCMGEGVGMSKECRKKVKDAGMGGLKSKMSDDDDDAPTPKKSKKAEEEPKKDDAKKDDAKKDE